jgi:hypothetical protein
MNSEIERRDEQSGDGTSNRNDPANPESSAPAVKRKRSESGNDARATQPTPKTGAAAPKRKKRFVL